MENFVVIGLRDTENEIKFNWLVSQYSTKRFRSYLMKKLPVVIQDINLLNESGKQVLLPFTKDEIKQYDSEFLCDFLEKVKEKYGIEHAYYEPILQMEQRCCGMENWFFSMLLFPRIYDKVLSTYQLEKKELHPVVIDDGTRKIETILEMMIDDLNYLTIVTKRPKYFERFADEIYMESGLIVELEEIPIMNNIKGGLVIDLSGDICQEYKYIQEDAVIILLQPELLKLQYLAARKKARQIIYGADYSICGENMKDGLALHIISCNNWKINALTRGLNESLRVDELKYIKARYDIRMKKLKRL